MLSTKKFFELIDKTYRYHNFLVWNVRQSVGLYRSRALVVFFERRRNFETFCPETVQVPSCVAEVRSAFAVNTYFSNICSVFAIFENGINDLYIHLKSEYDKARWSVIRCNGIREYQWLLTRNSSQFVSFRLGGIWSGRSALMIWTLMFFSYGEPSKDPTRIED